MRQFEGLITFPQIDFFNESRQEFTSRLWSRVNLWEFAALSFSILILGTFIHYGTSEYVGYRDYKIFLSAAEGDFVTWSGFYYAYWLLPFVKILSFFPFKIGLFIWGILNIFGIFLSSRVFGSKPALVLFSYQTSSILFGGQITGIILGGLGLLWIGLKTEKWWLAAFGLIVASTKFHIGLVFSLLLVVLSDKPVGKKYLVLLISGCVFVLSLLVYPWWPIDVFQRTQNIPPDNFTNISLWRWMGPVVLVLWIPPLLIPKSELNKLITLIAALCIATPYFQQYDLLILFVLPIGWMTWWGLAGYAKYFLPLEWLRMLVIIPIIVYLYFILCGLMKRILPDNQLPFSSR